MDAGHVSENTLFSDRYLKPVLFRCSLAVYFNILVTLRNVSRKASCKALRWDKVNCDSQSVSSNIVLHSRLIWLNGSITLIRAETERYDAVRFSKATTKSLTSGTGS